MKHSPKRLISPRGKRMSAQRPHTAAERSGAKFGATEQDVVPITPPPAQETSQPKPTLDPRDELTPG